MPRANPMLLPTALAALATVAGQLPAQTENRVPPRSEVQLSTNVPTTSITGFDAWRVAAPPQALPGDRSRGLLPTRRVAYAVWVDADANQDLVVRFLRSTDGGWSWDSSLSQDVLTASFFNFESFSAQGIDVVADGHSVFVALPFNRDGSGVAQRHDYCWVLGSDDQGQTWQSIIVSGGIDQPLSTGDQLADVDEIAMTAAGGLAHVVFEADYRNARGANGSSALSGIFYQAVGFDASGNLVTVHPEERRMENAYPSGTVDSDWPGIAVDGNVVAVTWQDDRVNIVNGQYRPSQNLLNTYVRVSADGGATFGAEHDATGFQFQLPLIRRSFPVVDGPNVYVFQEDHRFGSVDQIYLSFSNDVGQSWTDAVQVSKSPQQIDVDAKYVHADGGRIVVAYADDRNGPGNADNDIYVVQDHNAGADFAGGLHNEVVAVDNSGNDQLFGLQVRGDTMALVGEFVVGYGEGCGYAVSVDGGQSWTTYLVEDGNGEDVDDPRLAMTAEHDVVVIWQDDAGRGNDYNDVYVRGMKLPLLADHTATGGGLTIDLPLSAGGTQLAMVLASLTPPTSNGLDTTFGSGERLMLNFTPDALTLGVLSELGTFLGVTNPDGSFTWRFPNFAALIGQPIHYTAVWLDQANGGYLGICTDPIVQR